MIVILLAPAAGAQEQLDEHRRELISASNDIIDDAVQHADPLTLRGFLYFLTQDEEVPAMQPAGNLSATRPAAAWPTRPTWSARAKAAKFLKAYRDEGAGEIDAGSEDLLVRSLSLAAGVEIPDRDREIWLEEAAFDPWVRGITWPAPPTSEQLAKFTVGIIGTGLSGLNAAAQLKRAGIPFIVFEKNPEVGGTWFENNYPGARVDTPSRGYTHTFGVEYAYPYAYCPRDENLKYMQWVADKFGLREHIEFNTEVDLDHLGRGNANVGRNRARPVWLADLARQRRDQLRWLPFPPPAPNIEGMDSFKGVACHTAQWPVGLDLAGKRVAVIGSGASGYQTTPEIAKAAAHTTFFQRNASWCFDDAATSRRCRRRPHGSTAIFLFTSISRGFG